MPLTPQQELQTLSSEPIVDLYEIDLSPIGINIVEYFCSSENPDTTLGAAIDGRFYKPWPITSSGFESTTQGSLPQPTIDLANIKSAISVLLIVYKPRGALVRRRRIYRKHLDGGTDPNPDAQFEPEEYILDRWDRNDFTCTLRLVTELTYLNLEIPARRIIDLRTGE
jgi:lambda family phage minor tail protein L